VAAARKPRRLPTSRRHLPRARRRAGARAEDAEEEETPADTWCKHQGTHTFCSDFDGKDVRDGWDGVWYTGAPGGLPGSKYEAVASDRSAPNALSIYEPAMGGEEYRGGPTFSRRLGVTNLKGVRVALDLRIDAIGIDTDVHAMAPVSLTLAKTDDRGWEHVASASLDLRHTKTELLASPAVDDADGAVASENLPRAKWVHVELDVDLASSPATVSMTYDGTQVAKGTYGALDVATIDLLDLQIGMTRNSPHASAFEASFDNVVLDVL